MSWSPSARDVWSRGHVIEEPFEESVVVYATRSQTLHRLAGTSRVLWDLLERPRAVAEIVDEICASYSVPSERVLADVTKWAEPLIAARALVVTQGD